MDYPGATGACVVLHLVDNRSPTERRSCFSRSFLDTAINIVQLLCIEVSCIFAAILLRLYSGSLLNWKIRFTILIGHEAM
jgi:hypothetical protein